MVLVRAPWLAVAATVLGGIHWFLPTLSRFHPGDRENGIRSSSSSSSNNNNNNIHAYTKGPKSSDADTPGRQRNKRTLYVHVVPHSHDDVGWLKTIDQYYYGRNNTIQLASVREVLGSVVEALDENPSRTFVYAEQKFFAAWWEEQTPETKDTVRRLVSETRQLTFANGGWCMHDEAATHYMGMIDQTTLGHNFLKKTFGYVPTVGWQLDPFGHSSVQSSLMTYAMGFDALYFGRIDYQDLQLRHATKECEGLWNARSAYGREAEGGGNDSGSDGSVFWGLSGSYDGMYGPPGGYCFDADCGPDYVPLIERNRRDLIATLRDVLLSIRQQSDRTRGDHVMITMGEDFQYREAAVHFANLDLLLGTVARLQEDENGRNLLDIPALFGPRYDAIRMFYSSPEHYTECKYNETVRSREHHREQHDSRNPGIQTTKPLVEWTTKRDDFFPYSDCPNCFWAGYFASRPALKRFERVGSSFLMAVRQIESSTAILGHPFVGTSETARPRALHPSLGDACNTTTAGEASSWLCGNDRFRKLEDAAGVLQHHDGVSGTSKQHVAYDYAKRLQAGIDGLLPCTIRQLERLLLLPIPWNETTRRRFPENLSFCQLLNETRCDVSVEATRPGNPRNGLVLYAVIYNSLAWERSEVIHLPVGSGGKYLVEGLADGTTETLEARPLPWRKSNESGGSDAEQEPKPFVLSFLAANLPAIGAKVFRIRKQQRTLQHQRLLNYHTTKQSSEMIPLGNRSEQTESQDQHRKDGLEEISNGLFSVLLDSKSGTIRRIGTQDIETLSTWGYYTSYDKARDGNLRDDKGSQNSGAYVFRPSTPNQELKVVSPVNATVVRTALGMEVHTEYETPWIQTITRIFTGIPWVEIEYQVGPIPIADGRGKEVVTRYNTMVRNNATFYTDSNGREFMERRRNRRPTWDLTVFEPIAGNYYPVNTAIYVDEVRNNKENSGRHRKSNDRAKSVPAFAVVTDRSQGGGSIRDGTLELMVHRRTLADDGRGVGEPINETSSGITPCPPYGNATRLGGGLVIRGKHRIVVENNLGGCRQVSCGGVGGARLARSVMDSSFADPLVFVGSAPSSSVDDTGVLFGTTSFSGLETSLPKNVMLITRQIVYNEDSEATQGQPTTFLVRLGHQYGRGEDPDLSRPVDVDLAVLFPGRKLIMVQETTLSGNRSIEKWRKDRFDWQGSSTRMAHPSSTRMANESTASGTSNSQSKSKSKITLAAMEIRTFLVNVEA